MSIKGSRALFIVSILAVFIAALVLPIALTSAKELGSAPALSNGLALTPPMGWNSWNIFHENINETQIKQIADAMVSSGMRDAGYVYLNLDDNWMATSRDANGNLRADPTRFPSGMKALGDYIHSKGLKFGIYGDRGLMTCHHYYAGPAGSQSGSYGNEQRDANTFASWGVDYLKYDNCDPAPGSNMQTDYTNMKNALAATGRPIVYSICAWQYQSWMPATGNLWRTTADISNSWSSMSALPNTNNASASVAGPGAWNDPDMLEVGNGGMTDTEYRTHFGWWAIMAAPLIAGNDIRTMSQATKDILLAPEIIAVDQDPLGKQGTRVWDGGNWQNIWSKQLSGTNRRAVFVLNGSSSTTSITVNWSQIGLPAGNATVRDLWSRTDLGTFNNSFTASNIPAHGSRMLLIVTSSGPTTVTPTSVPPNGAVSINAGGSATGSFVADQYFSGGSTYTNTATIDMSQITSNPPPAALFNTERYGAMTYTIPNRSGAQTVTLYFSENYVTAAGQRLFNVSINGSTVLSNFDIYASAGGQNRAIARTFNTTANASGQVVIQFTAVTENPKISGITVTAGGPTPTSVPPTNVPPTGVPPTSLSINAGGSATGSFGADQYFSGGSTYTNTRTINMSQITTNPPPAAIFSTERYGAMTYTIPNLTAGRTYTVTLYFAETYVTAAGQRLFNVSINGSTVLSNFDIYASAGGADRAIARTFTTTANGSGQVVIQFISGTQSPKINGITVAG